MSGDVGDAERWEASLGWSMTFSVGVLALALLTQAWLGPRVEFRWPLTALTTAYVVLSLAVVRRDLGRRRGGVPPGVPLGLAVVGLGLAGAVAARLAPGSTDPVNRLSAATVLFVTPGAVAMVLGLRWPWRWLSGYAVAGGAVTAAVTSLVGASGRATAAYAGATAIATLVLASAGRLTAWMRDAGRDLADARDTRARLAVADERLRFARDLHDVHGRTLAEIAVHSQLGAELARRGEPGAVEHMQRVRRLADESLAATRRLVGGYRDADLAREVACAEELLRAGGVQAQIRWPTDGAGPRGDAAAAALAAVVREGVTNVLRHSRAREVVVTLDRYGDAWRLTLANDGRTGSGDERPGASGLSGLRERLAQVGGTLRVDPAEDRYVLVAEAPEAAAP